MLGMKKYPTASAGLANHRNDGIELCFVPRGEYHWQVEGRSYTVSSGEGFLTFPWQWHGGQSGILNRGELYWVILGVNHDAESALDLGTWSRLSDDHEFLSALRDLRSPQLGPVPELGRLFRSLAQELDGHSLGKVARVNAVLDEMLVAAVRAQRPRAQTGEVRSRQVSALVKKIQADPTQDWCLRAIGAHLGLEKSAAIRAFQTVTGLTPKAFVLKTKLDRAEELLLQTDKSITALAFDLGFSSSQHFSDSFHRNKGLSPSQVRMNLAASGGLPPNAPFSLHSRP